MSVALPDQIDPWRAVKSRLSFSGTIPLSQLERVSEVVLGEDGSEPPEVGYRLDFGRDPEGRALVQGFVRSRLSLPCQRCLGVVSIEVDAQLSLVLVRTDVADAGLDTLAVGDDPLRPVDLIEDELLLAIPAIPRHGQGGCEAPGHRAGRADVSSGEEGEVAAGSVKRPNPFSVLSDLRGVKRGD